MEERKLKGLKNDGIVEIKCNNCDEYVLCLQLANSENNGQSSVITRVAVQCYSCGSYSDVKQIVGQFYPGAPNDHIAFDIADDDANAPEADIIFKAWKK